MPAPAFEMLWDCAYCGTRKLLGKTHRFCPRCGAPQDPGRRYFPPEGEEVAAVGHVYVGVDRRCRACGSAMSAAATHCTQCGSDLSGAGEVRRLEDGAPPLAAADPGPPAAATLMAAPARVPASAPAPVSSRYARMAALGCGSIAVLAVVFVLVAILWRRQEPATVVRRAWERTIAVETLAARQDSAWCDQLPSGAYGVSRRREVRSHRKVRDGETCTNRRVDQGDGTFRVDRDCSPRYRDEPVYGDRCRFTIDRWEEARTVRAHGDGIEARWPEANLLRPGTCRGCEREGKRNEAYRVSFRLAGGTTFECALPEARWRQAGEDERYLVEKSAVTGSAFCSTLKPAR